MPESSQYELWFNNQSLNAGKACVYQNTANVTANLQPKQLAWMVAGANPETWIVFKWSLDYAFVWINQGPPESRQVKPADLATSNAITLSYNNFGFLFSAQTAGTQDGRLSVTEDDSVPSVNNTVVGIGMSRAGTFALAASPNQNLFFTPAPTAGLTYCITFGAYTFQAGDVLDIAMLNRSGLVQFPFGVSSMTAVLNSANAWEITAGKPANMFLENILIYEAGVGLVA